jgi:mannosyltransferase
MVLQGDRSGVLAWKRPLRWPGTQKPSQGGLADVVVANFHRRYTGVSATIQALVPCQRRSRRIGLWDWGDLPLPAQFSWIDLFCHGWDRPLLGRYRIWHARRDLEILMGLVLKHVLRQPWKVVFTSAAPKRPGYGLQKLLGACDAVIATSERSAAFLPRCTTVIHHGVDTHFYRPGESSRGHVGERSGGTRDASGLGSPTSMDLGAPQNSYLIGAFGRIRPSKGTDLLVSALVEVLPEYPQFSAFFTGLCKPSEQAYLEAMQTTIKAAGLESRIKFLGDLDRESVRRLYQQATLCVAASRREGFGLTPLEAMASGCAVLTSDAGVWPRVVDSLVGLRFETGRLDDLIEKLRTLLADPGRLFEMGRHGRERAEAKHSLEQEADAINRLYLNLGGPDFPA